MNCLVNNSRRLRQRSDATLEKTFRWLPGGIGGIGDLEHPNIRSDHSARVFSFCLIIYFFTIADIYKIKYFFICTYYFS